MDGHIFDIVDPTRVDNWDEMILTVPNYTFFHSSRWAHVLVDTYHFKPLYLTFFERDNCRFILPLMDVNSRLTGHRGISLPFTDNCEPLMECEFSCSDLLRQIYQIGKKHNWKYLEFRGCGQLLNEKTCSKKYYGHALNIARPEDELFSGIKSSGRRNIRKALKDKVTIKIDNTLTALNGFYRLNCLTRKKHGLPPQPFSFFRNIYKHVISNKMGSIYTATFENKIIAAAIFFHFGAKVIYKFGASDQKYLQLRANNLVMWEAIRQYASDGFEEFDFGKTEFDNEGLRRYKLSWGVEERIIQYYKYDFYSGNYTSERSKESGWYNHAFGIMPVSVLKLMGNVMYKHIA